MTNVLDPVALEFFRAPSKDVLERWKMLVAGCHEPVGNDGTRARLAAHRALLAAISSDEIGTPDARCTWVARLARNAGSGSQEHAILIVEGLATMLIAALTPARPMLG